MVDPAKSNLNSATDRFVGRGDAMRQLSILLGEGNRLVTLVGPAGTGKTRLAQAVGEQLLEEYAGAEGGGVWLCELAPARDLDGLCSVVGRALGIPPARADSGEELARRLGAAIASRGPIVLVLDNFEQLAEHAPASVSVWLAAAPDLRMIVTSREALRVRGETRFEVPPLRVPEAQGEPEPSEATELFIERVRAVDPAFQVTADNRELVRTVVRRLEGIPLALELAATRVEMLGLQGLLDALDKRLDVLVGAGRETEARHATLRAAIDSSWAALSEDERECLAKCAVFRGGLTPGAVTAVLGRDALAELQSLRDKSLLRRLSSHVQGGAARFGLFEAIREFATEQLEKLGGRDGAEVGHASHFLAHGESLAQRVVGPDAATALDSLWEERGNLTAGYEHAHRRRDADAGELSIRFALVLDAVTSVRGPFGTQLALLEEALGDASVDDLPAELWVRALRARARARLMAGTGASAHRDLDAALTSATDLGEPRLQAEVMVDLAVLHHNQRETSTAKVLYERALLLARDAGDQHLEGRVLGNLAALLHDRRKFDEALPVYRDALARLQEVGDQRLEAIHVANLGILEQERGELERARGHFEAALELLVELGDGRLEAIVMGNLGTLEHEEEKVEEARACHERAVTILRSVGDRHSEAMSLGRLARANAALGWLDDARACMAAAERLLGRFDDPLASEAIRLERAFIDTGEAAAARQGGDHATAAQKLVSARARIEHACKPVDGEPSWVDRSDDMRAAVRLLEKLLHEAEPGESMTAAIPRPALIVGPEARWFEVPGGDRQDLKRRKALRLILASLVDRHRDNPGAGLDLESLLAAGWPGERVVPTAGANRVYVALTTLRKLGLRGYLLSQDDGYLLDPALPVERI